MKRSNTHLATYEQAFNKQSKEDDTPTRVSMAETNELYGSVVAYRDFDGSEQLSYGEWRSVPGFSSDKLVVSSLGFYCIQYANKGWTKPTRGSLHGSKRYTVNTGGYTYLVHRLICRAFHGPETEDMQEVDHIDRDSTNNASENLRWVNKITNASNKNDMKDKNNNKPILVRKFGSTSNLEWEYFSSSGRAGAMLGVASSNLCAVARGRIKQTGGFEAKWAPPKEKQEDLKAGDDSNMLHPPLQLGDSTLINFPEAGASTEDEEWKMAPGVDNLKVSTRGRVQRKNRNGWSYRYTPTPTVMHPYPRVSYNGKATMVHTIVWTTFNGQVPKGMTIDHKIPGREWDNRICHLRPASTVQQNSNKRHKTTSQKYHSFKKAVQGKPQGASDSEWELFESTRHAERDLNKRFGRDFFHSQIGQVANGKKESASSWVFRWHSTIPKEFN